MSMIGILSSKRLFCGMGLALLCLNIGCAGTNGWAMNKSGMRQYSRGHYAQARHQFARAIAHNPCNADYRHNLAMAIQKQGDPVASEKILRHNLTIDAMHQPTYHALAQLMVNQGRTSEAQDLLASWVATQPYIPESNIEMAWFQRETGDVAGAEQSLQMALKARPGHPVALAQLGQLYQSNGRNDLAASYYQRSLAAKWDQPEVQSRLATLTDPNFRPRSRSAMMQGMAEPQMAMSTDAFIANGPALSTDPMLVSYSQPIGDPNLAGAPMLTAEPNFQQPLVLNETPMMAMAGPQNIETPFGDDQDAASLEDLAANPAPKRHRARKRNKSKDPTMANFPLPNFDGTSTAWVPAGTIPGQPSMAYQPSTFQSPVAGSDLASIPTYNGPVVGGGAYNPTPINGSQQMLAPQADPAHAFTSVQEMTASLPVVDPH